MRKNKSRLEKRLRQGAFERSLDTVMSNFVTEVSEPETYDVVRTKRFPLKPMTVDEAILQMNLLGHSFFAFRNQEDDGAFAVSLYPPERRVRTH
jgi:putative sigma-54 modulation protein